MQSIQDQWNAAEGTMNVGGDEYSVSFKVTGSVVSSSSASSYDKNSEAYEANENSAYGAMNVIDISTGNKSQITSDRSMTLSPDDLGGTTPAHEVGHLLGLGHDGGNGKGVFINPPSIMSGIYNSVSGEYSTDGLATKWNTGPDGKRTTPFQGVLDKSKRRVLPRNVTAIGAGRNVEMYSPTSGVVGRNYRNYDIRPR